MCRTRIVLLLVSIMFAALLPCATGAPAAAAELDDMRSEVLGVLTHARVDVDLRQAPVKDALAALAQASGLTIVGRWRDDRNAHGMNPDTPVSLRMRDAAVIEALETIIDQATLFEPCTWQLRSGWIEVGTHRRLAQSGSIETRSIPLTDLTFEPPYFGELDPDARRLFDEHPYRAASLYYGRWKGRKTSDELMTELLRAVVEIVEPGNWNHGDELRGALPGDPRFRRATGESNDLSRVASLRRHRDSLIVSAPDFIHRATFGYPPGAFPRELAARLQAADAAPAEAEGTMIRLVRVDPRAVRVSPLVVSSDRPQRPARGAPGWFPSSAEPITIRLHRDEVEGDPSRDDRPPPVLRASDTAEEGAARLLGALVHTRINVQFDEAPAREAIRTLGERLAVPIIGRFGDDEVGHGLSPDTLITIHADNLAAIVVLEEILAQSSAVDGECTWQVRRGFIEVGTKHRLSVPGARQTRLYFIRDLMFEPTSRGELRVPPELFALQHVETVVTFVEPDAWDWGQPLQREVQEEGPASVVPLGTSTSTPDRSRDSAPAGASAGTTGRRYVEHTKPAIIRHWRDVLIVHAPDYIHRQIGGYPTPIPPGE